MSITNHEKKTKFELSTFVAYFYFTLDFYGLVLYRRGYDCVLSHTSNLQTADNLQTFEQCALPRQPKQNLRWVIGQKPLFFPDINI